MNKAPGLVVYVYRIFKYIFNFMFLKINYYFSYKFIKLGKLVFVIPKKKKKKEQWGRSKI